LNQNTTICNQILTVIANAVLPAFQNLQNWTEGYVKICRNTTGASALPNGSAFYQAMVTYYTTTTYSPQAIHDFGVAEVNRILPLMNSIALKYNNSLANFLEFLRTSPQFYAPTTEDYLDFIKVVCKNADAALPSLFGFLPRCPYGVTAIPANKAPTSATAYYNTPDKTCTRPGMYNVNTYNLSGRPLYTTQSTSLHEAVPGHHLQLAIQMELDIPLFRQNGEWNAYIEGWALYSETLGTTMGFYQTDFFYVRPLH